MDDAESIKDDLDYYMENHNDENFIKNDNVYDHLDLDSVIMSSATITSSNLKSFNSSSAKAVDESCSQDNGLFFYFIYNF